MVLLAEGFGFNTNILNERAQPCGCCSAAFGTGKDTLTSILVIRRSTCESRSAMIDLKRRN